MAARLAQYATARLDADLSALSDSARLALRHLVAAARVMDGPFRRQVVGEADSLLSGLGEAARRYVAINAGPWDRLDGDAPFLPGAGSKPPGAALYPPDADADALLATADLYPERALTSPVTLVRDGPDGLRAVPYRIAFADAHADAAHHLRAAADLLPDSASAQALRLRADALDLDAYARADSAWATLRDPALDAVIGPTETWEDGLLGRKAVHTGIVLVRADDWREAAAAMVDSARARLDSTLGVGVEDLRERPQPVSVADAVALAGDANAGPKPTVLDLPNDSAVRATVGGRLVLLRNVIAAKTERVLVPVADVALVREQRRLVTAEAAVGHALLHQTVHAVLARRPSLGPQADALDEARADALALVLADSLAGDGRLLPASAEAHAVTFVASALRGVRLGATTPSGRAWLVVLDRLRADGALVAEDGSGGLWRVVPERVAATAADLARDLGAVDSADAADVLVRRSGRPTVPLAETLDRLDAAAVPLDIVFEQRDADGGP